MQQIQRTNKKVDKYKQILQKNSRKTEGEEKRITVAIEESQGKIHSTGKYGREGSTLEEGPRAGMLKRILGGKVRDENMQERKEIHGRKG